MPTLIASALPGQPLDASGRLPFRPWWIAKNRRQRKRQAMTSPFYAAEHDAFRDVMRRFVEKEIEPYAHEWDEAGEFPRELPSFRGARQREPGTWR